MSRTMRRKLSPPAAFVTALLGGMLMIAPATAQSVPPLPGIGPGISGCAVLAGLSPCLGRAVPVSPIAVLPGFGGDRNVDVDKEVDRSRTPGRIVIQ